MNYRGHAFSIEIGDSTMPYNIGERVKLKFFKGGWARILLVAESRLGKSAHAKDIIVKASKIRKCCIFSIKGEWENHITEYSKFAPYKQKMTGAKIIDNFAVKISSFDSMDDFSALGFAPDGLNYLNILVTKGYEFYKDDIVKFDDLLNDLPDTDNKLMEFNIKYGGKIYFKSRIFSGTKVSLLTHWNFIKDMFWFGSKDKRDVYNFRTEWENNDHLIINITDNDNKARALCGHIIKKIREIPYKTYPLFVFEEMTILFPQIPPQEPIKPSSVTQIYEILTQGGKEGIAMVGITQKLNQIYIKGIDHIYTFIRGKDFDTFRGIDLSTLKWNPEKGLMGEREFVIINKGGKWSRYTPDVACCRV